ncbi:MAG: flagellar hook-length control protein FliK [Nitrospinae bacterium]|nr:flagellar hook-length control protein FliK [Nitrospinota bacterium]
MTIPVLADLFMKGATSLIQVGATGKAVSDNAFQKIFDSSMENSTKAIQNTNEANEGKRNESDAGKEAETSRLNKETKSAAVAKSGRNKKENHSSVKEAKQADEEILADKIEKLKKNDPKAYDSIIANLDNMNLGDLLSKLGLNLADMSGLKPGVDLAGAVPEDLKLALISGDSKAIGSALVSLGIGGEENGKFLSALADKAAALADAKTISAGESTANMKNDSSTPTLNGMKASKDAVASQASSVDVSPDNSGLQNGSSNAKDGSNGMGSNTGSSTASILTTAPAGDSKPEVSALDSFKLADPASLAQSAQGLKEAAPQQAVSKPALTIQNLTNETDQASGVNTQTGKTDQAQAPANARPASTSRQTFERMVLDQVVEKSRVIVRPNGSSNMVIKLDPPTLGRVDMRIEIKEGVVRAAIVADNHDVKQAIDGNIEALKRSLNASGLKVDEISVTVGGEQGFQFKNDSMAQNAGSQSHGDSGRRGHGHTANSPVAAVDESAPARVRAYGHSGLLNVVA